jgi:drug/metabolite transporter (DMT)-like permease
MAPRTDERSLGELFAELSRDTGLLVRKEMELATTELTGKAKVASMHAATVAAGGALAHAGLLVLLAALVSLLVRLGVEVWLSAGIVAFLTMAIGYFLVNKGLANLRRANLAPTQTIQSIKETTSWTNRTPA